MAVTGAAGYLGRALVARLAREPGVGRVVALDRRADLRWPPGVSAHAIDVAAPGLERLLRGLDAVFHLAFVLAAKVPDAEARRTNLEGTRSVTDAVLRAGVGRLVVAGSVSAYGAVPGRKLPLAEDALLEAGAGFRYAHHKALVERWLDGVERAHPDLAVVRLRMATILGSPPRPGQGASLLRAPVLVLPPSLRVQVLHVDDAARACVRALQPEARGPYNVAGAPPLSGPDLARLLGKPLVSMPAGVLRALAGAWRALGGRDPERLDYLRHPILVDCARIRRELGWSPEHSAADTLRAFLG